MLQLDIIESYSWFWIFVGIIGCGHRRVTCSVICCELVLLAFWSFGIDESSLVLGTFYGRLFLQV